MKTINIETAKKTGQKVELAGWVHSRRDHGKIIFIDLRDRSGLVQVVFSPDKENVYKEAETLRPEWVILIQGKVKERPRGMQNPKITTGKIEIEAEKLEILSQAKTLPFEVDKDTKIVDEETRMKYRYLDIRSERMKNNLDLRHKVISFIRNYLDKEGFWEVETPILTKSTPEGARDYLVPSRLHAGKFYALPQSPQQYKQLLMVAGIEKYYQIARCFRDEDQRGDRQPEFTQLDLEMSFVTQEDILSLVEDLFVKLIKTITPEKKITKIPFPRLSHSDVMKKYKTDRPDLRKNKKDPNELAFAFIIDWPIFEYNKDEKRWDPCHHIFTSPKKEDLPLLDKDPAKVRSWQHDIILNGNEVGGGSIRITDPAIQEKVLKLVGITKDQIQARFGHMLKSFEYGVPPHGGIAPGLDRLVMILANEPNIREVMAFPKTGDGRDFMMDAPTKVDTNQLKDLHIKTG
ncbi:MAG: aspartate--tRNA ligase [Candidatus Berkelbacteria bacterium]|nr:aspartate--tRNA ligase [Candidatus Berkelbacteria bacterium]